MGENIVNKRVIVISAVNIYEGGALSILKECVIEIRKEKYNNYDIKILVHSKKILSNFHTENIEIIEFPSSRKSYILRLYYEYIYFHSLSKKWNVTLWFSLHDISPIVKSKIQAVYCHNPAPFRKVVWKELLFQPIYFYFTLFYKYIYKINISSNNYIVVQQQWLKNEFIKKIGVVNSKIIVAPPKSLSVNYYLGNNSLVHDKLNDNIFSFFFPSLGRPFKNFEVICKACKILSQNKIENYRVYLTIDGTENKYTRYIVNTFGKISTIHFIGHIDQEKVFEYYKKTDVLIFPSKLETWGLPITEFKYFDKPMLLVDMPYAYETLGDYNKVNFFNQNDSKYLAELMQNHIEGKIKLNKNKKTHYLTPKAETWEELFDIFLK